LLKDDLAYQSLNFLDQCFSCVIEPRLVDRHVP